MSCKDKDGGTHHYACECREAYVRRLEAVVKAAQNALSCTRNGADDVSPFVREEAQQELKALEDALASLKADVDVKGESNE